MSPRSLENLAERLLSRGLPMRYVERLLAELADHFEEARDQYMREGVPEDEASRLAEQRLGNEDALCDEVLRNRASQPFVRRHPTLSFVLGPAPVMIGSVFLFAVAGMCLILAITRLFDIEYTQPTFRLVILRTFDTFAYALTPTIALGFCHLAWSHRCSPWLAMVASLMLCLLGGLVQIDLVLCPASGSLTTFQRFGVDAARLGLPLVVFVCYALVRLLMSRRGRFLPRLH